MRAAVATRTAIDGASSRRPKGVVVTETSNDPRLTQAIRDHAREVTGFVRDGMPAMMRGMMR